MGTYLVKMEHVPVFQVKIEIFMTSRNEEINNNMIQRLRHVQKGTSIFSIQRETKVK